VECACPRDRPQRFQVGVVAPTGHWAFNVHAGVHETIRTFEIHLPEQPTAVAAYAANLLKLVETSSANESPLNLTGGTVSLNSERRALSVSLQVDGVQFWANGEYPLSWFLAKPRSEGTSK